MPYFIHSTCIYGRPYTNREDNKTYNNYFITANWILGYFIFIRIYSASCMLQANENDVRFSCTSMEWLHT